MGVFEQAGTDNWCGNNEITPSVVATVNGIAVPRAPTAYDTTALGTTNGTITLPLSNATVTLSVAPVSGANGGCLLIGGHVITYTGTLGVTITGATCADSGTIASGTNVYAAMGFVAALAVGGANNWSRENVCEFGDVGVYIGNSTKAHVTSGATLTTTANQTITVDNSCHLLTTGTILGIPTITGNAVSFPSFTYTSISDTTLSASVTLSTSSTTLQVVSTSGWPASGTLNLAGYTVTYTSIVDGTNIGGCTVASGTATIASGTYLRSNTLNGCSVASSTLTITTGQAVSEVSGASRTRMYANRSDFPRSHGFILAGGSGSLTNCGVITGPAMGTNTYDAFHNVVGSSSSYDVLMPWENSLSGTNRWRAVVQDLATSTSNFNKWVFPSKGAAFRTGTTAGFGPGWFTFNEGPAVTLTVNSATPVVDGLTTALCANTIPTTITNFTNSVNGQRLLVFQDTNTTISNNSTIVTKSGSNISPPVSGLVPLQFKAIFTSSLVWYQI